MSERMTKIETQLINVVDKLDTHISEQREDFKEIKEMIITISKTKANKWCERAFISLLLTLLVCLLGVMTTFVLGKI